MSKLGVVVPYRNRYEHLLIFKEHITKYLDAAGLNYELIIVDQDNAKLFNRGMLLNIGFTFAKKYQCDYVVFHDVDMLPLKVDYSYSEIPLQLASEFELEEGEKKREVFDEYFGGVTMFPVELFEKVDGYSNKYWGWGYEDNDLLLRCARKNISLDTVRLKNLGRKGKALKFNGVDAYVKVNNVIDVNSNATIYISFYPDKLHLNHLKESDEFTVFSIPGYDFAICYNSFSRYNFCAFDSNLKALYVNSNIKTNYKTSITVTIDSIDNIITVYQDGVLIGQTETYRRLRRYNKEPYFYLGVGNPEREKIPNFFRGYVDVFAYYNELLSAEEVAEISNDNVDLKVYRTSKDLKIYYDANAIYNYHLTDLSNNENEGKIQKCEIVNLEVSDYKEVKVPFKRSSLFKSLKHEENGFLGNRWRDDNTRWNQLRFENEVSLNLELLEEDGLSTLQFVKHGVVKKDKITHITVGI